MNEFFAAEPTCFRDSSELRLLLGRFGPYAGRYLAEYPAEWGSFLTGRLEELGPLEAERVKTCLRRAHEQCALLKNRALDWDERRDWVDNAKKLVSSAPPKLNGLIVSPESACAGDITLDNFETQLPLTADEKVLGTVEEYLRVSRTLLTISPELFFVDPFLNPCKSNVRKVMEGMLIKALLGRKCQRVACFARTSSVVGERSHSWEDVENAWVTLLKKIGWPKERVFEYVLFDDNSSDESDEGLHPRYLLSIKGGIRFDKGFQTQPRDAKVDICPLNATIHEAVLRQFKDGIHKWKPNHRFSSVRALPGIFSHL